MLIFHWADDFTSHNLQKTFQFGSAKKFMKLNNFFGGKNHWRIIDKFQNNILKTDRSLHKNVLEPANIDPEGEFKNKTNEDQLMSSRWSIRTWNRPTQLHVPVTVWPALKKKSTNLGIFRRSEAVSRSSNIGNQISRSFSTPSKNWSPSLIVSEAIDHTLSNARKLMLENSCSPAFCAAASEDAHALFAKRGAPVQTSLLRPDKF